MRDAPEFRTRWKGRLGRDLFSFSDPGSLVELEDTEHGLHGAWQVRGSVREADFHLLPHGDLRVRWNGDRLTYEEFLASDQVADLRRLANRILRDGPAPRFVSTEARRHEDGGAGHRGRAVELLRGLIEKPHGTATRVLVLTGDSGAGKTTVLRRLTEHYAGLFLGGRVKRMLLYVNAQGRALGRLHEALATRLRDLESPLTYHSVNTLARRGILVPVIDGFDELLGVSGYEDAFSSLSDFLDDLEGAGCVLGSVRSTYYEEEFVARAGAVVGRERARWIQVPVRVEEWSEDRRRRFLEKRAAEKGLSAERAREIGERTAGVFAGPSEALRTQPFFFTRVVSLLPEEPDFRAGDDLLGELVRARLDRELTERLLDRHSSPVLTPGQFDLLMRELALEMWNLQTRELDGRSVREVVRYVAEAERLSETAEAVFLEKMPSLAFLACRDHPGPHARFAFEHEAFFFYFLTETIVSQFESPDADLSIILGRSALPEIVAERVARALGGGGASREGRQSLLERLGRADATPSLRSLQIRENAGRLVMALLRAGAPDAASGECSPQVSNIAVRNLTFPGGALGGAVFRNCSFEDVEFRRADLTGTRFLGCEAKNAVFFRESRIDPKTTRLEFHGLDESRFLGLRRVGDDEGIHDPCEIRATLAACGLPVPRESPEDAPTVDPEVVELLERLLRAYRRANPVCLQDEALGKLVSHPEWEGLKARLLEYGIVKRDRREIGGERKEFLRRRFRPDQIMAGRLGGGAADPRVRKFWRSLEPPAKSAGLATRFGPPS